MEWQPVHPNEFLGEVREGEQVEVQISPGVWVSATVLHDMETRISVKLTTPVMIITKTRTIIRGVFSKTQTVEEEEDKFAETWTSGRAYVRRPKK